MNPSLSKAKHVHTWRRKQTGLSFAECTECGADILGYIQTLEQENAGLRYRYWCDDHPKAKVWGRDPLTGEAPHMSCAECGNALVKRDYVARLEEYIRYVESQLEECNQTTYRLLETILEEVPE